MTETEWVWSAIDRIRDNLNIGEHFMCSLLGRVQAICYDKELVGEIPKTLQSKALQHGVRVISADYKSDIYTFEVMRKP